MSLMRSIAEKDPTPDPRSAVVKSSRSARADDDWPPITDADLVTDPAMVEAAERYAGELTHDREIEDLRAGTHPLQRRRPLGP